MFTVAAALVFAMPQDVTVVLPAPTGPRPVGAVSRGWVDSARADSLDSPVCRSPRTGRGRAGRAVPPGALSRPRCRTVRGGHPAGARAGARARPRRGGVGLHGTGRRPGEPRVCGRRHRLPISRPGLFNYAMPPERGVEVTRAILRTFFDHYLGRATGLATLAPSMPEVRIERVR